MMMMSWQPLFFFLIFCGLVTCQGLNELDYLNRYTCGLPTRAVKYDDGGRISKGDTAADGQFPWYAGMVLNNDDEGPFNNCGASVLTPRVLVTAAHCLVGKEDDFGRGRIHYRVGSNLALSGDVMKPQDYQIHPQYNETNHHHDIALVFLRDPIPYLDYPLGPPPSTEIHRYRPNTVCLPRDEQDFGDYISFQLCGLGMTYDRSPHPYLLQWATVHTPSPLARAVGINCTESRNCFPDRMILTYDNDEKETGSCQGDSGGPLVRMNPPQPHDILLQRATLAGIVSKGRRGCGGRGTWTIYTRVAHYTRWIRQEIKKYFDELKKNESF